MIQIRYQCGHDGRLGDAASGSPRCHCGETRVVYVKTSRPPRFSGSASGPYAEFKAVDPAVVNVATAGPLRLKERSE